MKTVPEKVSDSEYITKIHLKVQIDKLQDKIYILFINKMKHHRIVSNYNST
jgi:hypothetical protein